jgi:hypothetical protein
LTHTPSNGFVPENARRYAQTRLDVNDNVSTFHEAARPKHYGRMQYWSGAVNSDFAFALYSLLRRKPGNLLQDPTSMA